LSFRDGVLTNLELVCLAIGMAPLSDRCAKGRIGLAKNWPAIDALSPATG
jgi:hypothetical protein